MLKHEGKVTDEADITVDEVKLLVKYSKVISRIKKDTKRKNKNSQLWRAKSIIRKKFVLKNTTN